MIADSRPNFRAVFESETVARPDPPPRSISDHTNLQKCHKALIKQNSNQLFKNKFISFLIFNFIYNTPNYLSCLSEDHSKGSLFQIILDSVEFS